MQSLNKNPSLNQASEFVESSKRVPMNSPYLLPSLDPFLKLEDLRPQPIYLLFEYFSITPMLLMLFGVRFGPNLTALLWQMIPLSFKTLFKPQAPISVPLAQVRTSALMVHHNCITLSRSGQFAPWNPPLSTVPSNAHLLSHLMCGSIEY